MIDLRFRSVRPRVVVDINRIAGLDRIDQRDGRLRIGPLVRHARFAARPGVPAPVEGSLGALMALMAPWIAHPPIRARGTLAGSVAWGHPCAEWGALTAGLGATVEVRSVRGTRVLAASEWFVAPCRTARGTDEIVTAVDLPDLAAETGVGFAEHRRSAASFALVAAATTLRLVDGRVADAHVGLAGAAPTPQRAIEAEEALAGRSPTVEVIEAAARAAAGHAAPLGEPHASVAYRRHVVGELVWRALRDATDSALRS